MDLREPASPVHIAVEISVGPPLLSTVLGGAGERPGWPRMFLILMAASCGVPATVYGAFRPVKTPSMK